METIMDLPGSREAFEAKAVQLLQLAQTLRLSPDQAAKLATSRYRPRISRTAPVTNLGGSKLKLAQLRGRAC
ncbi:MAG: hypothetical protein JWO19_5231 [Bryobacterales bacterium]|jgi:hypothetical protein|nr:hypothetical protein [Bryobacterales bacterium]